MESNRSHPEPKGEISETQRLALDQVIQSLNSIINRLDKDKVRELSEIMMGLKEELHSIPRRLVDEFLGFDTYWDLVEESFATTFSQLTTSTIPEASELVEQVGELRLMMAKIKEMDEKNSEQQKPKESTALQNIMSYFHRYKDKYKKDYVERVKNFLAILKQLKLLFDPQQEKNYVSNREQLRILIKNSLAQFSKTVGSQHYAHHLEKLSEQLSDSDKMEHIKLFIADVKSTDEVRDVFIPSLKLEDLKRLVANLAPDNNEFSGSDLAKIRDLHDELTGLLQSVEERRDKLNTSEILKKILASYKKLSGHGPHDLRQEPRLFPGKKEEVSAKVKLYHLLLRDLPQLADFPKNKGFEERVKAILKREDMMQARVNVKASKGR